MINHKSLKNKTFMPKTKTKKVFFFGEKKITTNLAPKINHTLSHKCLHFGHPQITSIFDSLHFEIFIT